MNIHFPRGHLDTLNKGKSIFSGSIDNNINTTKLIEIEVFKIINK
jgi:hypothetical protein